MGKSFKCIVAATHKTRGIAKNNAIPWRLPGDLKWFGDKTTRVKNENKRNAVVMGRNTWDALPNKWKPLPGRINIVLTTQTGPIKEAIATHDSTFVASSLAAALELSESEHLNIETVWICGGQRVYTEAVQMPECEEILFTRVHSDVECDTFFPEIDEAAFARAAVSEMHTENEIDYEFETWQKINREEMQYLDLIRDILDNGVERGDRTGTGTIAKFGAQMRFDLRNDRFPLLTSKRVFWRGLAEELVWFVSGSTNATELQAKNIRIWDGNASREFLDSRGLQHREEGDLGPVYGFQWRHFGAEYSDMHADYTGKGVDQLAECIRKIKETPNDRRIIMSAWNPADLDKMALPPCHMFAQFFVANGELSCQMYQRSCDMGLGVPFNIASYALLTRMIAQVCDLKAGDFIHTMGDAHVYLNHVEPLREQLKRVPRSFPTLTINPNIKDIDGFSFVDFSIDGYKPYPKIAMQMAV